MVVVKIIEFVGLFFPYCFEVCGSKCDYGKLLIFFLEGIEINWLFIFFHLQTIVLLSADISLRWKIIFWS